jgi:hypothetical protein
MIEMVKDDGRSRSFSQCIVEELAQDTRLNIQVGSEA